MAQVAQVVLAALILRVPGRQHILVKVAAQDQVLLHLLVAVAQVEVASSLFTTQPVALHL